MALVSDFVWKMGVRQDELFRLYPERKHPKPPPKRLKLTRTSPKEVVMPNPKARMQALGRLKPGKMNKSESAYADHLEALKKAGDLLSYQFEAVKFKLAGNTFYSPDFLVISSGMFVELHEFKGFWQDDARVKIKVAAALYPFFRFVAVTKDKNGYQYEDFDG